MKESHPVEVAEYARARGIDKEPAFEWWVPHTLKTWQVILDRIPSTTPGAEPPRDARDSGSARSHSTHLETISSDRP